MNEANPGAPVRFGLIVVGDEVLNGSRLDSHLAAFRTRLQGRGHELAWHWLLPDDPETLTSHLAFSMDRADPVFVCGGIGATPDDHTRACAAAAASVALTRHPEAAALLEAKFGATAYPHRILMADLPAGAELVPNPINQIPGFALRRHWFLPGFPDMAWPMADWVLDRYFAPGAVLEEAAVEVRGVPESRLIPLMQRLGATYPNLKLFSLPHMGEDPHILLGFRGRGGLGPAMTALCRALASESIAYRERPSKAESILMDSSSGVPRC